jgi:hypothetical protein
MDEFMEWFGGCALVIAGLGLVCLFPLFLLILVVALIAGWRPQ